MFTFARYLYACKAKTTQFYFTQVAKQILNCLKMAVSATHAYVISQRLAAYMTTYIYFQEILLLLFYHCQNRIFAYLYVASFEINISFV